METFDLESWIEDFRAEFCETMQWRPEQLVSVNVETSPGSATGSYPALALRANREAGELALPPGPEVTADPTQLRQVVWNLCDNAIKYGLRDRTDVIEIRFGRLKPAARPFLEVADRGPGVRPEDAERIFEPFFSGAASGVGTGTVPGARTGADQRRHFALRTAARRRKYFPPGVRGSAPLGGTIGTCPSLWF